MCESTKAHRTPYFEAQQSDRYYRQQIIRDIESLSGNKLIVYETDGGVSIDADDVRPFADLLVHVDGGQRLDLMIHSAGGDIDAAEKIVYMCRKKTAAFRVLVPEFAKSAATLIALASDEILMSLTSELGPIDTQIAGPGPGGAVFGASAQMFLDEFERIKEEVDRTKELSPVYYPVLQGLSPGFLGMLRHAKERSEEFAKKWLKNHMKKDDHAAAERIASQLSDVQKWHSHGVVIDAEEAKKMGINVREFDDQAELWRKVWFLHCCCHILMARTGVRKLFESASVSLAYN